MQMYKVRIAGNSVNISHSFVKEFEIEAENELEARIKVSDKLKDPELKDPEVMINPAPERTLYIYTEGPEIGVCTIAVTPLN